MTLEANLSVVSPTDRVNTADSNDETQLGQEGKDLSGAESQVVESNQEGLAGTRLESAAHTPEKRG
ncbi:MAG: hypothetical protein EBU55_08435 [Betaproteobacteria bacterium]|nr:hypothetical protein [Betaproteobacteria bacterium]